MSRKKTQKVQKVPAPQPKVEKHLGRTVAMIAETDDPFDTMMSALDWYFHVSRCQAHSREERADAFHAAYTSFIAFTDGDLAMDAEANAPTSRAVH